MRNRKLWVSILSGVLAVIMVLSLVVGVLPGVVNAASIGALQQQVDELKEHLKSYKTLHASSSVKNIYNRCEVVQHYQSEQTRIINPTFGAMYDIHDNEEVKAG